MLIEDFQVVLNVAEFRNITAAAAHLGMRTATASAALKRIDALLAIQSSMGANPADFENN